jgi:hypothetical protein
MTKNKIEEDSLRHKLHVIINSYCSLHNCEPLVINSNNNYTEEDINRKRKRKHKQVA